MRFPSTILPEKIEPIAPEIIPNELRDYLGKGSYWMEPTTKRRRTSFSFGARTPAVNATTMNTKKCNINLTSIPTVSDSSDSETSRASRYAKRTIHRTKKNPRKRTRSKIWHQNGVVRMIGKPGVRGRWAWIDQGTEIKIQYSPIYCDKQARKRDRKSGRRRTNTDNQNGNSSKTKEVSGICTRRKNDSTDGPTQRRNSTKLCDELLQVPRETNHRIGNPETKQLINGTSAVNRKGCSSTDINIQTSTRSKIINTRSRPRRTRWTWIETPSCDETTKQSLDTNISRNKTFNSTTCHKKSAISIGTSTATNTAIRTASAEIANRQDGSHHQKFVFRAIQGPDRPIVQYALDLISLVCNNACCAKDATQASGTQRCYQPCRQVHRVLDKPAFGRTTDTESEKERLMRLQFRHRFASAVSTGMSPIEFSKKLLELWGGRLEEVAVNNNHPLDASGG